MKKILPILKKVAMGIGIASFLFILYALFIAEDTTEMVQNNEQIVAGSEDITDPWKELEERYFAEANEKGWPALNITNSEGEEREYVKKNNNWVRKNSNTEVNKLVTNTQSKNVDKYGMTSEDWALEIADINIPKKQISKNEELITNTNKYIKQLDDSIDSVQNAMGNLDNTGIKLAQDFLNKAKELRPMYLEEISILENTNDTINKLIDAVYGHNKELLGKYVKDFESKDSELQNLFEKEKMLYISQAKAFDTFYNYYKLAGKSYSSSPIYNSPTYTPQTRQYNTDCSINSYYGGTGGTASCTTYSPSSSAISACAYIKNMTASQSYIDTAYAKCLKDNSQ